MSFHTRKHLSLLSPGILLAVVGLTCTVRKASADQLTWHVSFDVLEATPEHVDMTFATGDLVTTPSFSGYKVIPNTLVGTQDGNAIVGLPEGNFPGGNDNLFYPAIPTVANPVARYFDTIGLAYVETSSGEAYETYQTADGDLQGRWNKSPQEVFPVRNFVFEATPEPSAFLSFGIFATLGGILARRCRKRTPQAL